MAMKESKRGFRGIRLLLAMAVLCIGIFAAVPVFAAHSTVYNGVNYARVYDYSYYTKVHPSLSGKSDRTVLSYFVNTGMNRGEQAISSFNPKSYRRGLQSLRIRYGTNYRKYYQHFMSTGYKSAWYRSRANGINRITKPVTTYKGFNYARVYDFNYYMSKYPSLNKKYWDNDVAALEYFVKQGLGKKQQASRSFYVESYRLANAAIRATYGTDYPDIARYYCQHPSRYGGAVGVRTLRNPITKYKGIELKNVFDYKYYTTHNSDVYKYSPSRANDDAAAIIHFATVGIFQGKVAKAGVSSSSSAYKQAKTRLSGVVPNAGSSEYVKANKYSSNTKYLILVNRGKHQVYIFSGKKGSWTKIKTFACCVGAPATPTVTGVFQVQDKGPYFLTGSRKNRRCWYWTRIHLNYLFHSVIYDNSSSPRHIVDGTMGRSVSHGCIRLAVSNAKWIYDKMPRGTKIVIYN